MRKLERVMNMSSSTNQGTKTNTPEMSETDLLEMRLGLLSQQEMQRAKSNAELMRTLKDLHTLIKEASQSVQRAAHEVRGYPVEVVTQVTTRVEQSVKKCEDAAERASKVFRAAENYIENAVV